MTNSNIYYKRYPNDIPDDEDSNYDSCELCFAMLWFNIKKLYHKIINYF